MTIIGFNPAREYDARHTNTLQNHIRSQGYTIVAENKLCNTMTEFIYKNDQGLRYAYIQETGGMSEAPGQESIISDARLTYQEATNALLKAENQKQKEDAMKIWITIYPQDMSQESASHAYLQDAAARFANELTSKIRAAYPDAELDIDIRPAKETGPDGGVSCEDQNIQEHVQHLYDQTFNQGNFWPEPEGYCIYCGQPVYTETAPAYDDDERWADLALEHDEDCPWITTRAHQLEQ